MFTPFRDARLGPTDIAPLLGVSRVTVSMWLNGHAEPHKLIENRVRKLLDAVSRAVEANDLPVPGGLKRDARAQYIRQVVAGQLKKTA